MKDSQRKAAEVCAAEVAALPKVDRDNLSTEDLIKLREKLKEAMEMKKKIEEESNREVESRVVHKKQVVNKKILKTVRIVVAHINPIDGKGKVELEKAVGETSKVLDELAYTNRTLGWKVNATARTRDQNDESLWEVNRVPEETPALVVAGVLGRQLVTVIGRTGDLLNVWPEEETYKLLVPDSPIVKLLGRKAIGKKLREENKDIKNGKRYPKYWGQAKVMGFICDVIGAAEAERLVKNGIKWEGKTRRVLVLRKGEDGRQKLPITKKVLV